jgi:hypothetical protein
MPMKTWLLTATLLVVGASVAQAQTAPPDLKGTWRGARKAVVFGTNTHHPAAADMPAPRIREIDVTYVISGQEGALAWGYSFSAASPEHEPTAWAIASDGKTISAADTDGYLRATLVSADRLEVCYTHAGVSPSKSIVASCGMMERRK